MRWTLMTAVVAGLLAAGCEAPPSSPKAPAASQAQTPAPEPPPSGLTSVVSDAFAEGSNTTQAAPAAPAGEVVREKAVVGVGKKGRDYGAGLITTPVSVYFRAPQMMTFRIQIPDAMNKFKGVNGYYPRSHEEFMQKIIQENMIHLPELPSGQRYVYDPKKAAEMRVYDPADPPLFVEHTK